MNVEIPYSKNWNNKLDNDFYTTIRIWNPKKYKVLNTFHALLSGKIHHTGLIIDTRKIYSKDMNDWITRLDAGLSLKEFQDMMRKMYEQKLPEGQSIENTPFVWVLCMKNK